jgi:phosphatidylglycerophosphate synthase
MLSSVAAVLAVRGILPTFVVAILVGRDLVALLGSLLFQDKIRVNKVGKTATAILMAAVAVIMYRPGVVGEIMFYSGLGLSLVAGALYVRAVNQLFWRSER